MKNCRSLGARNAGVCLLAALAAVQLSQAQTGNSYVVHNLSADQPGVADHVDPNLINPWGISFSGTSPFWVSNAGSGTSTLYNGLGQSAPIASPLIVTIPPGAATKGLGTPTGQIQNSLGAFAIGGKNPSFIFATLDGTISGDVSNVAIIAVDNSASGAVYTGLAAAANGTSNYLYVANFSNASIDVYDTNYKKTTLTGSFSDPATPAGYAPFNVTNIGGKLYVEYARQNAAKTFATSAAGNGSVSIFDLNGNLLQHVATGGTLNAPWGVAIAPATFGAFAGDILVGNFGDGAINAFNATTGAAAGQLQDATGKVIAIPGLWALDFGNGGQDFQSSLLYVVAGPGNQTHGLFASIQPTPTLGAPVINAGSMVNAASFAAATAANGAVAPGSIASLFGSNLSSVVAVSTSTPLASTLGDTNSVSIGGVNAPLFFASNGQINLQVPFSVTPGTQNVVVTRGGTASAVQPVTIAAASPGIFTTGQNGTGQGAILNTSNVLVTTAAPATAGDIVQVFCTGLGATTPAVASGSVTPSANLTEPSVTNATVTATVGGTAATVKFAGLAPGYVGLYQVNVQIPAGVAVGNAVPLVLSVNGINSNAATLALH